jgi:hypothetical protein
MWVDIEEVRAGERGAFFMAESGVLELISILGKQFPLIYYRKSSKDRY